MTTQERKTILKAIRALDDWIVTDFCESEPTSDMITKAYQRIDRNGGTLAYATQIRAELEDLLK